MCSAPSSRLAAPVPSLTVRTLWSAICCFPSGSLIYLLFCVTHWGWGFDQYLQEANTGAGIKLPRWLKPVFQFVLPVLILVILIQGLV